MRIWNLFCSWCTIVFISSFPNYDFLNYFTTHFYFHFCLVLFILPYIYSCTDSDQDEDNDARREESFAASPTKLTPTPTKTEGTYDNPATDLLNYFFCWIISFLFLLHRYLLSFYTFHVLLCKTRSNVFLYIFSSISLTLFFLHHHYQ